MAAFIYNATLCRFAPLFQVPGDTERESCVELVKNSWRN
jgi:hypothetical protein